MKHERLFHRTPSGGFQCHCPCGYVSSVYSQEFMASSEWSGHLEAADIGVDFMDPDYRAAHTLVT